MNAGHGLEDWRGTAFCWAQWLPGYSLWEDTWLILNRLSKLVLITKVTPGGETFFFCTFEELIFWGHSGHGKEGISIPSEGKLDPGGVLKPY